MDRSYHTGGLDWADNKLPPEHHGASRVGHSKVGITLDLYSHVMPGMQDSAVIAIDEALRAALKGKIG